MLGLATLIACWWLSSEVVKMIHLSVPGSLLGMAGIAMAVRSGWLPQSWMRAPAAALIRWMPLFFVPAGVALMVEAGRVAHAWVPIVAGAAASTIAVLAVAGWIHQRASVDG
jgi:holin-like protein